MKHFVLLVLLAVFTGSGAQNIINWNDKCQLQLSDFQSAATEVGKGTMYGVTSGASFGFSFQMSQIEFMFTKNFNSKVTCTFQRNASSIVAVDSIMAGQLVKFSRYSFDLAELYARKFRKRIYEEKGAFSDVGFYKPVYEHIYEEFNQEHTESLKRTDMGRNEELTRQIHEEVLKDIAGLSDFCQSCTPPKKKKAN